jgi:NAD-dependent oxidoreductase involved in siderophore biosynthesis
VSSRCPDASHAEIEAAILEAYAEHAMAGSPPPTTNELFLRIGAAWRQIERIRDAMAAAGRLDASRRRRPPRHPSADMVRSFLRVERGLSRSSDPA